MPRDEDEDPSAPLDLGPERRPTGPGRGKPPVAKPAPKAVPMALVGELHPARWSLGLIQPDNVLIRGRAGSREVVPVDLGFAWRGSFGSPPWEDSPGRPDWLDPQTPSRWLWDHEPVCQQFADPENGVFPPPEPTADVRTLGRLFAWLISGQTGKDVPMVGGRGGPPPPWAVVADAAAGRIPS